jgi:hypothetical protein
MKTRKTYDPDFKEKAISLCALRGSIKEVAEELGHSIKSNFELIWNLKEQNTKLWVARDILLPKLMNGQIEI